MHTHTQASLSDPQCDSRVEHADTGTDELAVFCPGTTQEAGMTGKLLADYRVPPSTSVDETVVTERSADSEAHDRMSQARPLHSRTSTLAHTGPAGTRAHSEGPLFPFSPHSQEAEREEAEGGWGCGVDQR